MRRRQVYVGKNSGGLIEGSATSSNTPARAARKSDTDPAELRPHRSRGITHRLPAHRVLVGSGLHRSFGCLAETVAATTKLWATKASCSKKNPPRIEQDL